MPDPDLTEELITAAMAKAHARVCVGSDRCYAFPLRSHLTPRHDDSATGWEWRQPR